MSGLPTLKSGLELQRAKAPAVFTGVMALLLALVPCVIALMTVPTITETLSVSTWIHNGEEMFKHLPLWELLRARWPYLITAIVISLMAGAYAGYDAWEQAPLVESFLTPNPSDPRIYYDENARLKLRTQFQMEAGRFASRGIWIAPFLNLPFRLETRNLLVVAASGHGKSNIVRSFAHQMIRRGDKVILHCNKGDVTQCFDLNDVILISPSHRDGWAWHVAADIDGPAAAAEFAKDVIPASDQPFWSDSARLVLADTISAMAHELGTEWGPGELLLTLLSKPQNLRDRIASIDLSASPLLGNGDDDNGVDKTVQSIMSTLLSAAVYALRPMAYAWTHLPPEKRFSVKAWLSDTNSQSKIVIVQTSPNFEEMSTAVCGGILRRVCKALSDASVAIDANRRVSLVLDEMYSLGRVEGLAKALSVGREKGLVCLAALQSQQQLDELYSKEASLLLDLFQIKIYGRLTAGPSAELAEKTIGSRDIIWSAPNKHPEKDDKRRYVMKEAHVPVVTSTQLNRDFGVFEGDDGKEYVRAIVHYAGAANRLDWPLTVWNKVGEGFVPAEWTRYMRQAGKPAEGATK
ncbi:type IV secretion system DNA-binding domain-containing protein [Bradyrhizobium genosp. A]|uniref:type IV secretion system DNA-binding domain-containing protein n=1 Tax=Bradyrhizobium genosp. A TaxID=83626 RepID=UPI003CE74E18